MTSKNDAASPKTDLMELDTFFMGKKVTPMDHGVYFSEQFPASAPPRQFAGEGLPFANSGWLTFGSVGDNYE
jgi:hypothetical protein